MPSDVQYPSREKQTAYHEAAHAVVGHNLGQPCLQAEIRSGGGYGRCVFRDPAYVDQRLSDGDAEMIEWAERKMIVLAAGAEAVRTLLQVSIVSGNQDDCAAIQNLLVGLQPMPAMDADPREWAAWEHRRRRCLKCVTRKAKTIIMEPGCRSAIEALATRLLQDHCVKGEEVAAIIRNALAATGSV